LVGLGLPIDYIEWNVVDEYGYKGID